MQVSSTFYFKLLFVIFNGYFCVNGVEGLFTMYFAASIGAIRWEDIPMYRSDRLLLYIKSMYNTQPTSFYCVWNSPVYCTILYQGKKYTDVLQHDNGGLWRCLMYALGVLRVHIQQVNSANHDVTGP